MVSTITTSIVRTISNIALTNVMGLIAILILLALLIQKEVLGAAAGPRAKAFSEGLTIILVPLLLAFGVMALVHIGGIIP